MKKIVIDYRFAVNSNRGMARYCREIANCLFNLDKENQYYLVINNADKDKACDLPDNFHYVKTKSNNIIISEQVDLPAIVNNLKADILWCPYDTFPVKLRKGTKLIVTIHDLIFLNKISGKESFYKKVGRFYRKFILKKCSKRIDEWFTVSNYSKNLISSTLNIRGTGFVTQNCLSEAFCETAAKNISDKKDDFFFTVSGDNPSKNLPFLIEIFNNELKGEKLYIAGVSESSKMREVQNSNIKFLPLLTDEELIKYYATCKNFLFPSLEEGFGIPVIEALCCHANVICSNRTSLPEIVGGQGSLFNPEDKNSFLDAIEQSKTFCFSYNVENFVSWNTPAKTILKTFQTIKTIGDEK